MDKGGFSGNFLSGHAKAPSTAVGVVFGSNPKWIGLRYLLEFKRVIDHNMAMQADAKEFNLQQQLASIRRDQAEIDQRMAEIRKIAFESDLFQVETKKLAAETKLFPVSMIFQAMIAAGALIGAGAAIAKVFFP